MDYARRSFLSMLSYLLGASWLKYKPVLADSDGPLTWPVMYDAKGLPCGPCLAGNCAAIRWISVTERLPPHLKKVLVWFYLGGVFTARRIDWGNEERWVSSGWNSQTQQPPMYLPHQITHWAELPAGPCVDPVPYEPKGFQPAETHMIATYNEQRAEFEKRTKGQISLTDEALRAHGY